MVVLDCRDGQQSLLLGHKSRISALAATKDRAILATADEGNDSMIVLWNPETCRAMHTIHRPHKAGTSSMDFSPDGRYLVSISASHSRAEEQEVSGNAQLPSSANFLMDIMLWKRGVPVTEKRRETPLLLNTL